MNHSRRLAYGVGGRDLAERLLSEKPGLKVIYCSGYTKDMFEKDSPLRANENFLEKPFKLNTLLQRIRDCADAKPKVDPGGSRA